MPRDGDLTKRTPGTPLSEAELRQRREAARARFRWQMRDGRSYRERQVQDWADIWGSDDEKARQQRYIEDYQRETAPKVRAAKRSGKLVVFRGAPEIDPAPRPRGYPAVYTSQNEAFALGYTASLSPESSGRASVYAVDPRYLMDMDEVGPKERAKLYLLNLGDREQRKKMRSEHRKMQAEVIRDFRSRKLDFLPADIPTKPSQAVADYVRQKGFHGFRSTTEDLVAMVAPEKLEFLGPGKPRRYFSPKAASLLRGTDRPQPQPQKVVAPAPVQVAKPAIQQAASGGGGMLRRALKALRLIKRTPGTPLSEAEIEQRREAAKARWRKVGVAVGGAVAVAAAVAGGLAFRRGKIRAAKRLYRRQASDTYKAIHRLMEGKVRAAEVNHPIHGKISFSRGRDDIKSNGSLGHAIARRREQGVPEAQINRLIRQIPRAVTRGEAEQRGNSPLIITYRGQKVVFKPQHKKTDRIFGFRTTYEMTKRTPGAPLSDAERQQRKDAARARWATAGATLAGAAAGAALANREVRRRQREARTEMRRAKAETIGAEVARNRRVEARMEAVKAAAEKRIRTGWPVPLYRKVQEHEIHVARRDLRRLPAEFVNFDVDGNPIFAPLDQDEAASQGRRIADARRELDALENARPPRRVPVSATEARVPKQHSRKIRTAKADAGLTPDELARVQAGQSRAAMQAQILQRLGISPEEAARRAEAAEAELARQRATAGAKKGRPAKSAAPKPAAPKRKKVAEKRIIPVGVDRSIQELERKVPRRASVRRVKGVPDSKGLARIRDGLRLRFNDFHYARLVREGRRHGEQMKQARAAARGRYAAIMARMPNRRVRFAAMGAGALVGGAALGLGTYAIDRMRGVEKLAKADDVPRDPAEELLDAGSEAEQGVGERLAEVFRRLRDAPASELLQPGADLLAQIERGMRRATAPIANAMAQGAKTAPVGADVMSDEPMSLVFTFDARNPRVERFIREYREQRVRELTEEQADTVRDTVFQAALTGASPDEIARQVRQSIGLTTSQAAQVRNYRAQLEALDPRAMQRSLRDKRFDRTVSRAITTGTPLSPEQVDKMVDAYHRRYLAYRAMTIARTEGVGAANNGHVMAMKEWLAQNPNYTVVKTWIATKDERTRPDHKALHGQESVGIDTPFRCENGDMIRWPGDQDAPARQTINCRCTLSTRIIPRVQSLSAS